jgi:threonylcarbamoyladenosine tRNA methylthiotransferase MtaB
MAITFALYTLGCKVNQCDADALRAKLQENGYIYSARGTAQPADICIINTCTVTKTVDKKSLQHIRRARRKNPDAFIAVCGCMAKNITVDDLDETDFSQADCVFDARKPEDLSKELITRFGLRKPAPQGDSPERASREAFKRVEGTSPERSGLSKGKTRAFLKVQDGCDNFCAYCIVPYVRGTPTSYPIPEILKKAEAFIQQGTKEIVLTGIQLAAYGKDTGDSSLSELIRKITAHLPTLNRLRLSSVDPRAINDPFLQTVADTPTLCDHFHLSLQSGCDATLARMNRKYTTEGYAHAVKALRKLRPNAAITTDIIVGFPGESVDDFESSFSFAESVGFSRIHVFPYSPRAGTVAVGLPGQIPANEKKARNVKMLALAAKLKQHFLSTQVGFTAEILMETPTQGHTRNYCLVRTASPVAPNTLVNVHITDIDGDVLKGAIV